MNAGVEGRATGGRKGKEGKSNVFFLDKPLLLSILLLFHKCAKTESYCVILGLGIYIP